MIFYSKHKMIENDPIINGYFLNDINNVCQKEIQMPSTVKLTKEHLETITEVFEDIVKWKSHKLSSRAWAEFATNWAPSMVEQIKNNEFTINHALRNTPNWFIDQVLHTRVMNSSQNPKNAVPLFDTLKGKQAIRIMKSAAKGQIYYDQDFKETTYNELFKEIK